MIKIKLFSAEYIEPLERQINDFIAENNIQNIIDVKFSAGSPFACFVLLIYK